MAEPRRANLVTVLVAAAGIVAALGVVAWLVARQAGTPSLRGSEGAVRTTSTTPPYPGDVYDPVAAGEELPRGFRQLLPRDAIAPVYEPSFVTALDAGWSDGTLVIGVEIGGEARAYPISFLNRREMVIDSHAGIPTLVTW